MDKAGNFSNTKTTHAVIQGPAYVVLVVQDFHLIVIGDHTTYRNAHFEYFFLVLGTNVDEDILQFRGKIGILAPAGVNGRPTKQAPDNPLLGVNIDPFRGCNQVVGAAIAYHVPEAVILDVMDKPGDFIGMAFDHHAIVFTWVNDTVDRTIIIQLVIINIRFDVLQPQLLTGGLKTRW